MLIGYVSDERYLALHDVLLDFLRDDQSVAMVRSSPRGAVYVDLPPGEYTVELARDGYGAKSVRLTLPLAEPYHFRLMSDSLMGYMWPKWVQTGETSEYCIHSAEECQVSLWRYGRHKEFIRLINWHGEHGPRAGAQVTPDGDYTQTGVQWNRVGYDSKHHSLRITAPERSGLYYIHLKAKSGAFFSFPWVVAPATPSADIAVLASTNTWNAYNNFGGRSTYIHTHWLPDRPTMNARMELLRYRNPQALYHYKGHEHKPLSFMRPEPLNVVPEGAEVTDPIPGRMECGNAPAEWRFLGWLEEQGFAYDLWSEAQLHFGQLDLDRYKVLVLSVHPEYWSKEMYLKVKDWVHNRGGKLAYLGGNGMDGPVEFLDETALRYHNEWEGVASGGLYGDQYDSRFHRYAGESPANLLGIFYTDSGIMTAAPYRVTDDSHWIYAGTGLKNGDLFGHQSLSERVSGGASGHETDKRSPYSPPGTRFLAKGTNPDDGGAELAHYTTASGGEVFSAGSITWNLSLFVDQQVSRITANVLGRFLGR